MTDLRLAAKDGKFVDGALLGWAAPPEVKMEKKNPDLAKITFLWSENGFVPKGGLVVYGFKAAHALLAKWARHAPRYDGGEGCAYDKTGFKVEVDGLETYEGRFDIQTPDYPNHEPYDLIAHIESFNEYWLPLSVKMAKTDEGRKVEQAEHETRKAMIWAYRMLEKLEVLDESTLPEVPEPQPQPEPEPQPEQRGYSGREFRGEKYESGLDVKEIAKRFRADVKQAKEQGKLPKEMKVAVRISRYSMGCSCRGSIKAVPPDWTVINPEWKKAYDANDVPGYRTLNRYGERLTAALELLNSMLSAYRRDDSDSQTDYFDVNFYGDVSVSYDLEEK